MSKWRQKGFVQDSDEEEEESQLESQHSRESGSVQTRVEPVGDTENNGELPRGEDENAVTSREEGRGRNSARSSIERTGGEEPKSPAATSSAPRRPSASPFTPPATHEPAREPTESPDPLQGSPSPNPRRRHQKAVSSQILGSPTFAASQATVEPQKHEGTTLASQAPSEASVQLRLPPVKGSHDANTTSNVLGAFGIGPLSDDEALPDNDPPSDNDSLSEPPTELNSPEPAPLVPHPHRRTAVQVVIPSSTALQQQIFEQEARREFRQRKPIQLHPYALEGELYRREVQSRGLKPVARPRSPERRTRQDEAETQENEFDPNDTPSNSPPELDIPVSTPVQKQRKERPRASSPRRRASDRTTLRLPATQLRHPKRRKLDNPSTQADVVHRSIFDDPPTPGDIWAVPLQSPPYSSSPPLIGHEFTRRRGALPVITPAAALPTPSTSSVFQDDIRPFPDSELDPVPLSTHRGSDGPRRTQRIVLSDQSSSDSESSGEAAQSDHELRKVGKKIKGVLPASWLRFDREAQERREAQARERERVQMNITLSPEPSEPQRGVAQRVFRRTGTGGRSSSLTTPAKDVTVISDGSDNDDDNRVHHEVRNARNSAAEANAIASALDDKYANDDLDNMENDRLHLFALGGAKRKKQTKVTDAFGNTKRLKAIDGTARKRHTGGISKRHASSRKARRTPPPAMSVIDADISPSKQGESVPQFMRIARRQALRRPDLARQSLQSKQLQLHDFRDTADANVTLEQWRCGKLKPKANAPSRPKAGRSPLAGIVDNNQFVETPTRASKGIVQSDTTSEARQPSTRRPTDRLTGLGIFDRDALPKMAHSQHARKKPKPPQVLERANHRGPPPLRTGQLEGDESVYGRGHRKIAFEQGLRHADRQALALISKDDSFMNPQLARFLADDNDDLPSLRSANDIREQPVENAKQQTATLRRRLIRKKVQAQRVDIEAREFRQPSEPAVQDVMISHGADQHEGVVTVENDNVLQGLGPYGTRYPTTFDVTSLQPGTYFHASTLIGSEGLNWALSMGQPGARDLDEAAGYFSIIQDSASIRCGPWNDETSSSLIKLVSDITAPLDDEPKRCETDVVLESLAGLTQLSRSVIQYFHGHLSFSDPIDRKAFAAKMHQFTFSVFDQLSVVYAQSDQAMSSIIARSCIQSITSVLALSVQTSLIARSSVVEENIQNEFQGLIRNIVKFIMAHVVRKGIPELGEFLEQNKRHAARQNGVQGSDVLVEGVVVCMHAAESMGQPGNVFWDLVNQEILLSIAGATTVHILEAAWATLFTLVPFSEIDVSGIPSRDRRESFAHDDWTCISAMLRRIFELYPSTHKKHGSSLNDYVRANLARCHRLIKYWHWQRPESMLNAAFDFFGKNGLRQLQRESATGSVSLFEDPTAEQPLNLEQNDCSFHVALKCLALGLSNMGQTYAEKKVRSFVFRLIPNHGRSYPKDQSLDEESLAALRNHHDLLCTLYWAAPPNCRPKLNHIRCLVSHETSHREACRVNVRAWTNLTTFQLSTDEPYAAAEPFALWHKDIIHQTLKQYRLAKVEADDYLHSGVLDGTTDVSALMVKTAMEKNQEQVIATLRDCIAGMRKAMRSASTATPLDRFITDSDIVNMLELPHLEDRRLVTVIREALAIAQEYAKLYKNSIVSKESQRTSEDSQDYGDFPNMDDLDDSGPRPVAAAQHNAGLDFIQKPLWHLMSNAFGAETAPDDDLLMDCVDTWVLIADVQVAAGTRSWSFYIDPFSQASWQQLRDTEQSRKFGPYFLSAAANCSGTSYDEHRPEYMTALLLALADRESMLRFQHRLLSAIIRINQRHPLLKNLPFFHNPHDDEWDINADTVRLRRLALISSILSNMRDDLYATRNTSEVRRTYATMLTDFMTRLKSNFLQLHQGTKVTGAYVEFVQKIVQFLKQYTGDICPVLSFFTDSVAFPLPSTDPTYVVARLCGYAPKLTDTGTAKQLSVFVQTVAQQAAADNQQAYLVHQLTTAICSNEAPAADRAMLRSVLLQGIFPEYIEQAFSSSAAFLIARPLLQALRPILDTMIFDLRVTQPESLSSIVGCILAVSHAFIRGTEHFKTSPTLFEQSHNLAGITFMLESMASLAPLMDYICNQSSFEGRRRTPPIVAYMQDFGAFVAEMLDDTVPHEIPYYQGNAHAPPTDKQHSNLLAFCKRGLDESIKTNWSEDADGIWFGQGQAKRAVVFDVGSLEKQRMKVIRAVARFDEVLSDIEGKEGGMVGRRDAGDDVVV